MTRDLRSFRVLLGLRYRLLWAKARTSSGRMALLVAGYFLALLFLALISLGGLGAGIAAVRMGQGESVARFVLGAAFANALVTSVLLGFGLNEAFSDAMLRRYPLSGVQRMTARHLTALLDPLWLFVLALDLGFAIAVSLLGAARVWLAVPAALALVVANYLTARVLSALLEWLLATRAGPFVAVAGVTLLASLPAVLQLGGARSQLVAVWLRGVANVSPPTAAAHVMAGSTALAVAWGAVQLAAWLLALVAMVVWLERRPRRATSATRGAAVWEGPWDRLASLFGPTLAPLVGKMLRYYVRNPQFRYNYPFMLPILAGFVVLLAEDGGPAARFHVALGAGGFLGLCSGAVSLNAFGYDGAGFRRYFVLPTPPAAVVRAAALVSVLPGLTLLLPALALWLVFSQVPTDGRMFVMLLSAALLGIFFLPALGLWTIILAPRAMSVKVTFGNRLSWPANLVMMLGIVTVLFLPKALASAMGRTLVDLWWVMPLAASIAALFFIVSVEAAGPVFDRRREQLMSSIEQHP